ncbi:MAG: UbiH/UbiF/VisC/COQ6 family ubiquinone biosynthesis hydroxylase [Alphaproteobacteria bacterium]|nr:UbiH/UbiF/VisC/COQ6 family ubiquinone biosynthesis hydroxylase [Alphaproteobacteria bacterium]
MTSKHTKGICIIGGGLAGLSMAALLEQEGLPVTCIDSEPLARQMSLEFDGRTTAVSYGSRAVLERAGVWEGLTRQSAAIETIDILDGDSSDVMTFRAADVDADAFGWIVDNADLRRALIKRVQTLKNVRHITGVSVDDVELGDECARITLTDGQVIEAAIAIGADGRKSLLREKMGIGHWGRDYKQTAIVCLVAHEKPHNGLAVEHFRREGPFALLPFTDLPDGTHRSALVWTVHGPNAKRWVNAPEDVFNTALQERAGNRFGKIWAASRREAWPLNLVKSYTYTGTRAVLVAEAAHGMHPIAGQGLNMSLRDLDVLADLLIEAHTEGRDFGDETILKTYQRRRRLDNILMCAATDNLTILFSNDFLPLKLLRRTGLSIVKRIPAAMKFFMHQAMGVNAAQRAGKILQAVSLEKRSGR